MRIALLGNTQAQADRLGRLLPFDHELIKVPAQAGPTDTPIEVDAVLTIRFTAADARAIRCGLLQVSGVGLDAIALDAVPPATWICNCYEHEGPIAEYVMLAVLDHQIGFSAMAAAFTNEAWSEAFRTREPHGEAAGLTIGLIGFGHIGRQIAARARAFGMRVMAVTASGRPAPEADWAAGVKRLDEMLGAVDVLVVACPLTEATRNLVDARRLALLKPTALLINIARGDIVEEEALYRALESHALGGAVLDAWYRYPDPAAPSIEPSRFRFDRLPNVRCTPHASGWTEGLIERRYTVMAANLARFRAGEPLLNVVRAGSARPSARAGDDTADVKVFTASSSATAPEACSGHVLVSGSYGGEYNAWHAARRRIRGVVLNDAGVGKDQAGIKGLPYLDRIGLPAATADAMTCHIADGDHMLEHGIVSYVNRTAAALGCSTGQSVRECADRMRSAPVVDIEPPPIAGGKRYTIADGPGRLRVICLDAAPMLEPADAGSIAITGSHAALFRGQPDNVIGPDLYAVFFNDAGGGLDGAGFRRLAELDKRAIAAGTVSADSAPIGDSRAIYEQGILSHVNDCAAGLGGKAGMPLKAFVEQLRMRRPDRT